MTTMSFQRKLNKTLIAKLTASVENNYYQCRYCCFIAGGVFCQSRHIDFRPLNNDSGALALTPPHPPPSRALLNNSWLNSLSKPPTPLSPRCACTQNTTSGDHCGRQKVLAMPIILRGIYSRISRYRLFCLRGAGEKGARAWCVSMNFKRGINSAVSRGVVRAHVYADGRRIDAISPKPKPAKTNLLPCPATRVVNPPACGNERPPSEIQF